ncbi:AraC family transcriptional regulator [uncultured Flavobacterium sp.]|uniref:helix-turn-helix domain-containing protein n=1 Tax=uncultured Flavobacterium sp. TaxID=165435 RepID=UPI0025DB95DC|nr:helix-turn-helix domain-containing protein [uncultured Flavobacterium sp.]
MKFINPKLKLGAGYLLLLLPFVLSLLLNLYIGGHFYYDLYDIPNKGWISSFYKIEYYFAILFNVVFLILEYFILFKKSTMNTHVVNHDPKWIRLFYGFHVLLVLSWIVLEVVDYLFNSDYTFVLWLFLNALFYWIGYKGIYKFRLARNRYEIRKVVEKVKEPLKGSTKGESDNPYFQKMIHLFEEDKLYKNPKLSRGDIASEVGISVGYFSQIISAVSEKGFSDYLNHYRVEEVKRMMLMDEFNEYNILAIGLEAGFNSKSAFYTGFKKETGYTPSEYKKLNKK